jgi:hypothetical protein
MSLLLPRSQRPLALPPAPPPQAPEPEPEPDQPSTVLTEPQKNEDYFWKRYKSFTDWTKNAPLDELRDALSNKEGSPESGPFNMTPAQERTASALLAERQRTRGQPDRDEPLQQAIARRRGREI